MTATDTRPRTSIGTTRPSRRRRLARAPGERHGPLLLGRLVGDPTAYRRVRTGRLLRPAWPRLVRRARARHRQPCAGGRPAHALDQLDVDGPYLVVGHSLGAFHARLFAADNPDDVTGLMLLDPSHEDQWARFPESVTDAQGPYNTILKTLPVAARLGLTRLYHPMQVIADDLPDDVSDSATSRLHRVAHLRSTWQERRAFEDIGDVARRDGSDLGDLPVRVLSAGVEPEMPEISEPRTQLGRELAEQLSSNGSWDVIADADHNGMVSRQQHADVVAEHIDDMWTHLR